jgi:23S rRNA (uracil1939-C5)-methyltransferase
MSAGREAKGKYIAPCPHYPRCFGCSFIDLPYPEQLRRKRQRVVEAFAAHPALNHLQVPVVVPSPRRLGYRARVKLVVRCAKGEVAIGLYVPESHRVVDISSCPVHPRPVNSVILYLKRKVQDLGIDPYDEENDMGQLRYVDFRYGFRRRELSITLVTRQRRFPQGIALARALTRRFPFITGVIQNVNEARGNVIWGERFMALAGRETILEQIGYLKLGFPAGVFSQANPFMARKLYERVVDLASLSGQESVLDLYCGCGPISLYLAAGARMVWGIDENSLSISSAKQNARRNGINNCRFFAGDVAEGIAEALQSISRFDFVVLNPPRKGIQPRAMEAVLAVDPLKMIYVSCEPTSLARDLDQLVQAGYRPLRMQPFDMFPQTAEVETVVLLEKGK